MSPVASRHCQHREGAGRCIFFEYHALQSNHCQTSLTCLASSLAVSHSPLLLSAAPGTQIQWHRGPGSRLNYLANMATCRYWVYLLYLLSAICLGCKSYCRLMLMPPTTGVWRRQMANKQIRCGRGHHNTHSGHTLALVTEIRRVKGCQDCVVPPHRPCDDCVGTTPDLQHAAPEYSGIVSIVNTV